MLGALGTRPAATLLQLFLALSATSSAQAWDHVATEYPAGPADDFVPQSITRPDSTGYWAFGHSQAAFEAAFVHYGADGTAGQVRYPHNATDAFVDSIVSNPVALSDGGFAVEYMMSNAVSYFEFDCYLQRYDHAGDFRWQVLVSVSAGVFPAPCSGHLEVDAGDGIWVDDARYGADGAASPMTQALPQSGVFPDIVPDPAGTDFYQVLDTSIARYDRSGTRKWEWQPTTDGVRLLKLVVGPGGDLFGFGTADQHAYGVSLTSGGSPRWENTFSTTSALHVTNVATTSTADSFLAVGAVGGTVHLIKVNADGTLGWDKPFPPESPCAYAQSGTVVAAPNDDALFLYAPSNYCNQTSRLHRFKPDGTQIYVLPVTADAFEIREEQLRSLADGSTLLVLQSGGFVHVAADGSALAPPATSQLVEGAFYPLDAALADDGSSYFLAQREPAAYVARHFASDGTLLWQRSTAGFRTSATLATASDRMCIIGAVANDNNGSPQDMHVVCLSANDGTILWDAALTQSAATSPTPGALAARILASGDVVLVYQIGFTVHVTSLTSQGGIAHDTPLPVPENSHLHAAIGSTGQSAVVWLDTSGRNSGFASVTPGGTLFTTTIPVNPLIYREAVDLKVNDDSSVLLFANAFAPPAGDVSLYAYLLDAHGARMWTSPAIVTGPSFSVPTYIDASTLFSNAGNGYASVRSGSRIVALSMADGTVAWQADVPFVDRYALDPLSWVLGTLTPSASGQDLIATTTYVGKIRLTRIDATTGAITSDRFEACGTDFCGLYATGIGSDGALRVAADTLDSIAGQAAHVYTIAQPLADFAPIRIGQAGLDGAWYAQYSGGQGFTLDYVASARTIFMPWFTFAQDGANEPSNLAWYTLQSGALPTLATSADLAIAVSDAGAFNSGSVPGTQVGSAHLSFTDCSHGSLYYQFTSANSGAGGLITLTRLTPSTDPCVLADDSVVPAQNTNPPAAGFDARQSGSWFDPATGGQGIEMTIIPAGNGSAGVVFIPWFTFDPAGQSDDPLSQHWFTLQGDLSAATGGKVDLPIYRIIGGAFDLTPTSNFAQVGHATLTMSGCDKAQLDYQFDTTEVAHAFAGLSGTSHLVKIGGCIAP